MGKNLQHWKTMEKRNFFQMFANFSPVFWIWGVFYSVAGRRGRNSEKQRCIPIPILLGQVLRSARPATEALKTAGKQPKRCRVGPEQSAGGNSRKTDGKTPGACKTTQRAGDRKNSFSLERMKKSFPHARNFHSRFEIFILGLKCSIPGPVFLQPERGPE